MTQDATPPPAAVPPNTRQGLLRIILAQTLASKRKSWTVHADVAGMPGANVEVSSSSRGLRVVVAQGAPGEPGSPIAAAALPTLSELGFSGGGRKGSYRSTSVPRSSDQLAALVDRLLLLCFGADADFSMGMHVKPSDLLSQPPSVTPSSTEHSTTSPAPITPASDLGTDVLNSISEKMMIENAWSLRDRDSITWWSYRLPQRIAVDQVQTIQGDITVRITGVTDVVANVSPGTNVLRELARINSHQAMNAYVYNAEAQLIQHCCTAYIYQGTRWMDQTFATAALLQNAEAHARADPLAQLFGGRAATTTHPSGGGRPVMHDLHNLSARAIVPVGSVPSRFTEKDLDHLQSLGTPPGAELTRDGTSVLVSFTSSRIAIDVAASHPEYGTGVLLRLSFPFGLVDEKANGLAQSFNEMELGQGLGVPLMGAWTHDPAPPGYVVFVAFLPSVLHEPGLLEQWAAYMVDRSHGIEAVLSASRTPTSAQARFNPITDAYSNPDPTGVRDAQGELSDEELAEFTIESQMMADVLHGKISAEQDATPVHLGNIDADLTNADWLKSRKDLAASGVDVDAFTAANPDLPISRAIASEKVPPGSATPENEGANPADDLAPAVLDDVFKAMSIDAQWSLREARGFEWWAYRLRQRVWADPAREIGGDLLTRLHAETDYLKDVPDHDQTYAALATVNELADMSTFYFDPAERVIRSHATMYFHQGNRWMEKLLKTAVALQDSDAHASARQLPQALGGGVPEISQHPTSGERPELDDMLNVHVSMQLDMQPSPFTPEVFDAVLAMQPRPWVLATGGGAGLTAEFPFYDDVPAIMHAGTGQGPTTALLMASGTERNPHVGGGLLLRLSLPLTMEAKAASRLANDLNLAETREWTESHLLGSWCTKGTELWFVCFVPSLVARGLQPAQRAILMFNLIMSMRIRTNWARNYLSARDSASSPQVTPSTTWPDFAKELALTLEQVQVDQFLVLIPTGKGNHFVQFAQQGSSGLRAETTSNAYLEDSEKLDMEAQTKLQGLGWCPPTTTPPEPEDADGSPNYFYEWPLPIPYHAVAALAVRTLEEVLRVRGPGGLAYRAYTKGGVEISLPGLGLVQERLPSGTAGQDRVSAGEIDVDGGSTRGVNGVGVQPDPIRQQLLQSTKISSTLDAVAEAVSVASEKFRTFYVDRDSAGWRWSLTTAGGSYPLLRITAIFLKCDYSRIYIGFRTLDNGLCVLSGEPNEQRGEVSWAILEFEAPASPDAVAERIREALSSGIP